MCAFRILILSSVEAAFGVVQFNIRPSLTFELNLVCRFAILPVYKPHDNIGLPIDTPKWNISYLFRVLKFFRIWRTPPSCSLQIIPDSDWEYPVNQEIPSGFICSWQNRVYSLGVCSISIQYSTTGLYIFHSFYHEWKWRCSASCTRRGIKYLFWILFPSPN